MANKITTERLDEIKDKCNAALCVAAPDQIVIKIRRLEKELEKMEKVAAEAVELAQTLVAELAQARVAAVQWVTYDGTPETLPEIGKDVLLYRQLFKHSDKSFLANTYYNTIEWCFDTAYYDPEIGDRWAYLPEPPEVK